MLEQVLLIIYARQSLPSSKRQNQTQDSKETPVQQVSLSRNGSVRKTSGPAPAEGLRALVEEQATPWVGEAQLGLWHPGEQEGPKGNFTHFSGLHRSDSDTLKFSWQVTVEDFEVVCKGLYRALCIREKYMQKSFQRFPNTPSKYLRNIEGEPWVANENFYPGK